MRKLSRPDIPGGAPSDRSQSTSFEPGFSGKSDPDVKTVRLECGNHGKPGSQTWQTWPDHVLSGNIAMSKEVGS